uniref:Translocated promoter region a, nuclear basket protein n=1 Tax=Labrus bergylta TaxID=56723 RepID=A0A3Q3G582_9LABR
MQEANEELKTQHERFKADSGMLLTLQSAGQHVSYMTDTSSHIILVLMPSCEFDKQTKTKYEIEAEKRELDRLLEKRTQEVENLSEDVKRLNEKLTETSKVKLELQLKLDDIQSSEASVQHREKRMEQEKELLEKKIEWLTSELKKKTEELLNSNREKGKEILELKGNLKNSKEQVRLKQYAHIEYSCFNQLHQINCGTLCVLLLHALEKKVSEGEELKVRLEAELREKIKKMEKELENSMMKAASKQCCVPSLSEEQLNSMCPTAAAIAAIVKPGMKFFDLYNAYAECQTQLQLEKQEVRRVSRVLDEIVQEVESKAPVLKRQREEYESMQRSMASLCNKLELARSVSVHSSVCTLLVELEEARGNQVTKEDGSSANISSTSEVISSCQLTFRSVNELQSQNQNLQRRLRELEEEKDRQVSDLEGCVSKLQKEVEQLREQRNQQKQLADSNSRQRDMYKALLTQSTGFSLPPQGDTKRPTVPATRSTPQRAAAADSAQTAQAKAALKQLNDAFTSYKKEKAENDRMLNETNDRLQNQLSGLRINHAKLNSQLEFSNKRSMLQETVSAYRREISALQDKNQKMAATAQRHEHIIHTMSQDLGQAKEKLALEEVRVENLTKERDMLRQAESRLGREKEAILTEQRNQNLLLTNLKTIQLTMERTETDTRQRLNSKIEQLEAELASMKIRLDQEVAERHTLGRTMDAKLLEAKKQLETQNTLQQKTRDLLRSSEQQLAGLKAQLSSASPSDAVNTSSSTASQSEKELVDVKGRLRTAEEQKSELAEQLKNATAYVQQYKAVVLALEDSLKQEKEVQSRLPLEIRLKEYEEVQQQLEERISEAEKMKQQAQEESRQAVDVVEKRVKHHTPICKQQHKHICLNYSPPLSTTQTKLAGEAQAKYERELMLHAADVEALQELKNGFQQEAVRKRELEDQLNKSSGLLLEKSATWNTVERQMKVDLANKSRVCEDLRKQNALLHQQMEEVSTRSRQTQQQPQSQQLDLSFNEEGKTTEQILEILRFVRREKDIAIAQFEATEGEALRLKQRVEHQDREVKELKEALNAEREKMQATAKMLAQQEEQLKKMQTIGALQETNRLLKMDRDKLEQELKQFQAKVMKLQSDIGPLHHSMSQLSEKNGSLCADKKILEDDLKRWKAKAQQLISQQKDGNDEERQKFASEREAQQRRIAQLAEETAKLKIELTSSNSAQSQLQAFRDSVARLTSERDSLKKDVETKNGDILEKIKTINQVKKIGRRYKTQYEELKVQHDTVGLIYTLSQLSQTKTQLQQNQNQLTQSQKELQQNKTSSQQCCVVSLQLSEGKNREEQLGQQIAEQKEKTKKAMMGAKAKLNQLISSNEQQSKEMEELKQSKEEMEVRMNALKSQYEGRFQRMDRELRELRETQVHSEPKEELQDTSGAKVGDQPRSSDQRPISLKSPAQDRGSSSSSDPPTANIRPTPSTPSPSNKPSPSPGSKATPRASIRPMVTPATVPVPTPTATVMPTTQTDSQEAQISSGPSVHSTGSISVNTPVSLTQPTSTQATAFVQPTQQQAANQDAGTSMEAELPSTSSSQIGTGEQNVVLNPPAVAQWYSQSSLNRKVGGLILS